MTSLMKWTSWELDHRRTIRTNGPIVDGDSSLGSVLNKMSTKPLSYLTTLLNSAVSYILIFFINFYHIKHLSKYKYLHLILFLL